MVFCGLNTGNHFKPEYADFPTFFIFSSPEPKAQGELIVYRSSRRLCVCVSGCVSVCLWTFSNSNISATSGPIVTKFYLNHHWVGGKAALGFGPDRIGTLVSMATDSSHRVIMGENVVNTLAPSFLIGSSSYLQVTRTYIHLGRVRNLSRLDQGLRS